MTTTLSRTIARTAPHEAARTELPVSTSDAVNELLLAVGVRSVYGILGGGIAPFGDVMGRSALSFYAMRHEGGAAFAACEASIAAGRPTAVVTTTGPGLTNALTGVLAARSEGAHVIVISASTSPKQRGRYAVQEMSAQGRVEPKEFGRTFIVIWGEVEMSNLGQVRVKLKEFGGRLGRPPVYLAITPPHAPAPREEVRKEMLATMGDTSALTETLHLVLEGKGLKFSALRSMVASMFLLGGNRRVFVHDSVEDALKKTSLDPRERDDILLTLSDRKSEARAR